MSNQLAYPSDERLQRAAVALWDLRSRIADRWPTPSPEDSMRFAVTEAAEALDAWLTAKRMYVRNNPERKHPDADGELGDCAMMIITALGPTQPMLMGDIMYNGKATLDDIVYIVAGLSVYVSHGSISRDDWINFAFDILATIDGYMVGGLESAIMRRLQRIENKHAAAMAEEAGQLTLVQVDA